MSARLYVPSTNEATHPRCCDKGYPGEPGRASNKEGESWTIIPKPLSESIRQNRVMQSQLPRMSAARDCIASEMVAWPGRGPLSQYAAVPDRHGSLRRRASSQSQGHDARLIPTRYVRPYSKGQKNDFRDSEAIAEAVAGGLHDLGSAATVGRQKDDLCPPNVLLRAIAVGDHGLKLATVRSAQLDVRSLVHPPDSHTPVLQGILKRIEVLDLVH